MYITLDEYAKLCRKRESWKQSNLNDLKWVARCAEMYGTLEDIKEAKAHVKWKEKHNE